MAEELSMQERVARIFGTLKDDLVMNESTADLLYGLWEKAVEAHNGMTDPVVARLVAENEELQKQYSALVEERDELYYALAAEQELNKDLLRALRQRSIPQWRKKEEE